MNLFWYDCNVCGKTFGNKIVNIDIVNSQSVMSMEVISNENVSNQ